MKTLYWSLPLISLGLVLSVPEPTYGQGAIVFDDFLTDNGGMPGNNLSGPNNPNGFIQWSVTNGSIDLVGPAATETSPADALTARYVDLGGSTGDPGLFSFAVPTTLEPGIPYTLSFIYNSVDGNAHTATVNLVGQTFDITASTTSFLTFSQDFVFPTAFVGTTGGVSPLTFQDLGVGNSGVGIDRIMLLQTAPEPGVAMMFAIGMLALGGFRRVAS